mgnify:CR=1 FL=1
MDSEKNEKNVDIIEVTKLQDKYYNQSNFDENSRILK